MVSDELLMNSEFVDSGEQCVWLNSDAVNTKQPNGKKYILCTFNVFFYHNKFIMEARRSPKNIFENGIYSASRSIYPRSDYFFFCCIATSNDSLLKIKMYVPWIR